jgi:hypothetical protein
MSFSKAGDPLATIMPLTLILSFTRKGIPSNGRGGCPAARLASDAAASSKTDELRIGMALSFGPLAS